VAQETKTKHVKLPPDQWEAFEEMAAAQKLSLDDWIGQQCRRGCSPAALKKMRDHTLTGNLHNQALHSHKLPPL